MSVHKGVAEARLLGHWDTVVVGGGTAGASAAASAAREGNSTLVVEAGSVLGGSMTRALVSPMMPSFVPGHGQNLTLLEEGLRACGLETREPNASMGYVWHNPDAMSSVLDDLVSGAGAQALFGASLAGVKVEGARIVSICAGCSEGFVCIEADQFVDATGDALLSRLAGVPCDRGDSLGHNQMSSLRFEMAGIDIDAYRDYCLSLGDHFSPLVDGYFWESAMVAGKGFKLEPLFRKGVERGLLEEEDLVYYQCFSLPGMPGCMAFNCPHLAGLKNNEDILDRSNALIEGRRKIKRLVGFLTKMMPGFEHAFLIRTADMLGVRESWRVHGTYTFTEEDYLARRRFDDAVARGDWYIDVHSVSRGLVHMDKYEQGEFYEIPYRCLTNEVVENMLTVGRCISTTFLAQASVRIQPTVIDMGDRAGVACALAKREGVTLSCFEPRNLIEP